MQQQQQQQQWLLLLFNVDVATKEEGEEARDLLWLNSVSYVPILVAFVLPPNQLL